MSGIDEMYMENLEEWIFEENKVVTYKYLSRSLKCHVNVAKQMLFNFLEEQRKNKPNTQLSVVYLVSGLVGSTDDVSKLKVSVVRESDLEKISKSFEKILSRHIYSIQNSPKVTSSGLFATDLEVFREDVYAANAQNAIRNRAAVPRPVEQAVAPAIKKETVPVKKETVPVKKETEPLKKESKTGDLAKAFLAAKSKVSPEKTADAESKKPAATDSRAKTGTKKGAANNIASMFAKQASKPKQEGNSKQKENKDLSSETSPGKENMANQRLENRQEEGEDQKAESALLKPPSMKQQQSVTAAKKRKKTSKVPSSNDTKKRKRITVASDSESDGDEDSEGAEESIEEEDAPPPQAKVIHSDEEDEDDVLQATPESSSKPGRRRVKKLVNKTYMDEAGYMVTKKEVEYVSEPDDEPEPEIVKKPQTPKVEAPAAKKMKTAASHPKQPGIMNFFKKK